MSSDLKQQTISGLIWSSIEKFGVKLISFISNIILARLLSPDDYGCIGMLSIFIVISNAFIYGGLGSALIQKKSPTKEDYSTVFYWNLFVSLFFYIILFITAPSIANFYRIPLLTDVLHVLGIMLFINALSIIQITQFKKNLQFKKLAFINTLASIVSCVITIILAILGFGVWSLVIQQISLGFITLILLWYNSKWRPNLIFSLKSFKELFSYGVFILLSELLNSIVDNIQGLIIGRKFSATTMGYYAQARRLEEVPTTSISQIVQQVTFPVFSKIQDDQHKLYTAVKKSLSAMNFINIPLMVLLFIIAKPLIILLFSDKWLPSVPYFQILCIAGLVNCLQSVNYQVVCAVGRSKDIFIYNILKRLIGILLIIFGMHWGVEGILYGMAIGFYFTYIVNAVVATKSTKYSLVEQVKDILPIVLISFIAGTITWMIHRININYIILMIIQICLFILTYLILSTLFKIPEIFEYKNILYSYYQSIKLKLHNDRH